MPQIEVITKKLEILGPHLDERQRRLWAAAEALSHGRGGISTVSTATGMRTTIRTGIAQVAETNHFGVNLHSGDARVGEMVIAILRDCPPPRPKHSTFFGAGEDYTKAIIFRALSAP